MKCCIIDDDIYSIEKIESHISKIPELQLIGSYSNPKVALEKIKAGQKPDIVFLDIDMPELSGLEVASLLPKGIAIIFVTAYMSEAYNAFEKDAVDFILKPYTFERFVKSVRKFQRNNLEELQNIIKPKLEKIFIKTSLNNKIIQLNIADIIHIKSDDHFIYINLDNIKHMVSSSLKDILIKLPEDSFIRVHRRYIININLIKSIEGNEISMSDGTIIPLSKSFKDFFLKRIS